MKNKFLIFVGGLCVGAALSASGIFIFKNGILLQTKSQSQPPSLPSNRAEAQTEFEYTLRQFALTKNKEGAKQGFGKSAALDASYAPPRLNLAILAEVDGDWDTALRWQEELSHFIESSVAVRARSEIDRIQILKSQWATPGGMQRIQFDRALARSKALIDAHQFQDALSEAKSALNFDADRYEPFCVIADSNVRLGLYDQAVSALSKAKELAPGSLKGTVEKAQLQLQADYQFTNLLEKGEQQIREKSYLAAAASFKEAFQLKRDRGDAGLRSAMAYTLTGELDSAKVLTEDLVSSPNPNVRREATKLLADIADLGKQRAASAEVLREFSKMKASFGGIQEESRPSAKEPSFIKKTNSATPMAADGRVGDLYVVTGIKSDDTLTVRKGAGTNTPAITTLPNGFGNIQIIGSPMMNGTTEWVHIRFNSGEGWVRSKYLQMQSSSR